MWHFPLNIKECTNSTSLKIQADFKAWFTIFSFEHNYKLDNIVSISCKDFSNIEGRIVPVFLMTNKRGKTDNVSLHRCINKIPSADEAITEYVLNFGKYKGMSVKDIDDKTYLWWLVNNDILYNKRVKTFIESHVRSLK